MWRYDGVNGDRTHLSSQFPDRVYHNRVAVTAVAFSKAIPNLLAAGAVDGNIRIYDVRSAEDKPVLDTRYATSRCLKVLFITND